MKVYMIIEADNYELPVAVFETLNEVARFLNCPLNQVARFAKANGYRIEVVFI